MQESQLKTSWKQRLVIAVVAAILLGSSVAIYVAIVLGSGNVDYSRMTTRELESAYESAYTTYTERAAELSAENFDTFKEYKSKVKAYNATTANSNGVTTKDFLEGDGEPLTDSNYSAYYIGWCSDESIFDSSFDNFDSPTSLKAPIAVEPNSLIEGWYLGTEGMKLGGIREITIPGALAYGDSYEICGGLNSPLKFIIYAIEKDKQLSENSARLDKLYEALTLAYSTDYSDYSEIDYSDYVNATEE